MRGQACPIVNGSVTVIIEGKVKVLGVGTDETIRIIELAAIVDRPGYEYAAVGPGLESIVANPECERTAML